MKKWGRTVARWVVAAGSGVALALAYAPHFWWPLAVMGVAGLTLVARHGRSREAASAGYVFGLAWCAMTISWVSVLGWWVAALLVMAMAVWSLAVGWATHAIRRVPGSLWWTSGLWVASEFGQAHIPFGGFPWLRLAWTTVDQPLSGWLPVVGAVGTSWLVALVAMAVVRIVEPGAARPVVTRAVALGMIVVAFGAGAGLAARPVAETGHEVTVGIVQGDVSGTAGPQALGYARSVTNNHLSETITLMARARTGMDPQPELVVWPENSTDIDPTHDAETFSLIMLASRLAERPILLGAVMDGPGPDERQTSSLWWATDGRIVSRYDKRNLVPFGEFIPLRSTLLPLIPMLQEVGPQAVPGRGAGVVTGTVSGRPLTVGVISCLELAWDSTVGDTVRHGARIIAVQSNNGTYTGTAQPLQQFTITRARAMELRRDITVTTTNAYSGHIDARGRVLAASGPSGSWARTVTVPEQEGTSLGVLLDPWLDLAGLAATMVALGWALTLRRRRR